MNDLPATPLDAGLFWSWIVPALVFLVAAVATGLLYRHFARKTGRHDS